MPRVKFRVPSIGSMTHPLVSAAAALLAEDGLARTFALDPRAQPLLDGGVGIRDRRQVGLRLDAEIARAEPRQRDRVCVVREREREGEVGVHAPSLDWSTS